MKRTLALGDIHGCMTALDAVLAAASLTTDDTLIALGDYVDRGPDSKGVIERLLDLHHAGHLIAVLGNHDEMMLAALDGAGDDMWLWCGGAQTLLSYGHLPHDARYGCVPESHRQFLTGVCRPYHETDTHIFAHATLDPKLPLDKQSPDTLRWLKLDGPIQHYSGKTLICGHTKQRSGVPLVMPGTICIDTGVYDARGWVTCLHVESGEYWQANEAGQTRCGVIL
jgi:serine/threonine protein phosphatase 1